MRTTRYSSLSLRDVVCLCAGESDHEAWEEFLGRVSQPLRAAVTRTARMWGQASTALVEDLVQSLYLKLWEGGRASLQEFAMQCPEAIPAYLKKMAANLTHDHFRHSQTKACGGAQAHVSTAVVDPEASS
ncbi:MAG TPA: hypothetical protein VK466_18525, partial [Terriglobales bacterium]|nr:hypothetical protein [Terriglobales bacterium]